MVISNLIQNGGRRQESWEVPAEIVEHTEKSSNASQDNHTPFSSSHTATICHLGAAMSYLLSCIATTNTAPM